jgi:hypothetical protein
MANIYTTLAASQTALATSPSRLPDGNLVTGNVVWAQGSFTTTGTTAAGDVLYIAQLPKGSVVIPGLSFIDTEDCGTDISIKIGDDDPTADDDRYSTAISLATAGRVAFASGEAGPNPRALTETAWIKGVLVNAGSISVTTAKDFTVWVAYRLS